MCCPMSEGNERRWDLERCGDMRYWAGIRSCIRGVSLRRGAAKENRGKGPTNQFAEDPPCH